jgi:hypothetical protein
MHDNGVARNDTKLIDPSSSREILPLSIPITESGPSNTFEEYTTPTKRIEGKIPSKDTSAKRIERDHQSIRNRNKGFSRG